MTDWLAKKAKLLSKFNPNHDELGRFSSGPGGGGGGAKPKSVKSPFSNRRTAHSNVGRKPGSRTRQDPDRGKYKDEKGRLHESPEGGGPMPKPKGVKSPFSQAMGPAKSSRLKLTNKTRRKPREQRRVPKKGQKVTANRLRAGDIVGQTSNPQTILDIGQSPIGMMHQIKTDQSDGWKLLRSSAKVVYLDNKKGTPSGTMTD